MRPMSEARAAIAFEDVSVTFDGGHPALDHLSLVVRQREFLAIVGPSGSGKTTLLRLINRLAEPGSGTVRVEGSDVRSLDPIGLRRRIGYVFQNVGLFPHMSVADNIGITPKLLGDNQQTIAARVDELLQLVQLESRAYRNRFPHQLSGGQRQRVGDARVRGGDHAGFSSNRMRKRSACRRGVRISSCT